MKKKVDLKNKTVLIEALIINLNLLSFSDLNHIIKTLIT